MQHNIMADVLVPVDAPAAQAPSIPTEPQSQQSLSGSRVASDADAILLTPPDSPLKESLLPKDDKSSSGLCHLGAPGYAFLSNVLANGVGTLVVCGCPIYVAAPCAVLGGCAVARTQYQFISKTAATDKVNLVSERSDEPITCGDQCDALVTCTASISEGSKFGFATYLGLGTSIPSAVKLSAAGLLFIFRSIDVMQTEGQKAFLDKGKKFGDTWIGFLAEYLTHIPGFIDINTIVREGTPNMQAAGQSLAVNAAFNRVHIAPRLLLMALAGSGEWYMQKGYNVRVMAYIQELAGTKKAVGLAWLINNIIRVYNESIGNIVNGRIINESVGVVVPPQLVHSLSKIFGQVSIGYAAAKELPSIMTSVAETLSIATPALETLNLAENIGLPVFILACAWTAFSHLKAASHRAVPVMSRDDNTFSLQTVGTVAEMKSTFQANEVEVFSTKAWECDSAKVRLTGLTHSVSLWAQEIKKKNCVEAHPKCGSSDDSSSLRRRVVGVPGK